MNFKEVLELIQARQSETFCTLPKFLEAGTQLLPVKSRGLYWLWTKLNFETLANCLDTEGHKGEVPIRQLIERRKNLLHVSKVEIEGFLIVYNGIGGYKVDTKGYGLRSRILQELRAKNVNTGSLNLMNRGFCEEDWAVSYFDFNSPENQTIVKMLQSENCYSDFAADLEMLWRLEYGHPILCRY